MHKKEVVDVLVFAEDPGAAHYLIPVISRLLARGSELRVLGTGIAVEIFARHSISFEQLSAQNKITDVLDGLSPRLILVGTACNPNSIGLKLISFAKKSKVQSIAVVDAAMNAEIRFCGRTKNPIEYLPDQLIVPDVITKQEFEKIGVSANKIHVCGHPYLDLLASRGALANKKAHTETISLHYPGQKVVIFASECSSRVSPISEEEISEYSFLGRGLIKAKGRTEIILEEFLDALAQLQHRPFVILRAHPKDDRNDYASYANEIDMLSHGGMGAELIMSADLVVGMTSMLLQEAVALGIPTLSIIPRLSEKKWMPTIEKGLTPCVTTRAELNMVLKTLLEEGGLIKEQGPGNRSSIKQIITIIETQISQSHQSVQ